MNFLAIERSSSSGSAPSHPGAALYRDADLLASTPFPVRAAREDTRPPNPKIIPHPASFDPWASSVSALFTSASVAPAELSAILLAIGPGSFSGIRAAIAFAQGLALPHSHIKILGVSTAAVIAWQHLRLATPGDTCAVVGDARREHIWQAKFQFKNNRLLVNNNPPTHTAADFTLIPYSAWDTGKNACAPLLSPDAERLLALSPQPLALLPAFPSAEGLASLHLADPSAFIENPLPIYLHNAV